MGGEGVVFCVRAVPPHIKAAHCPRGRSFLCWRLQASCAVISITLKFGGCSTTNEEGQELQIAKCERIHQQCTAFPGTLPLVFGTAGLSSTLCKRTNAQGISCNGLQALTSGPLHPGKSPCGVGPAAPRSHRPSSLQRSCSLAEDPWPMQPERRGRGGGGGWICDRSFLVRQQTNQCIAGGQAFQLARHPSHCPASGRCHGLGEGVP